ncbi:dihydrofolate reductase [Salmonella phage SPAsTU]|nr:dihydrofolate reductase [Salmonella phage SPAsTU]
MKLSIIAACDLNGAIGKGNKLPWRLPADLANFKALTTGKIVIMGRRTWESLGCSPLPNRKCIVVSRDPKAVLSVKLPENNGVVAAPSLPTALSSARTLVDAGGFPPEVFIIGGAEIYHQTIDYADTIYLSRIELMVADADAYFPEIDRDVWRMDYRTRHLKDNEKNTHDWHYQIWNRVNNGELAGSVRWGVAKVIKAEVTE